MKYWLARGSAEVEVAEVIGWDVETVTYTIVGGADYRSGVVITKPWKEFQGLWTMWTEEGSECRGARVCAWCGRVVRVETRHDRSGISHGICLKCSKDALKKARVV